MRNSFLSAMVALLVTIALASQSVGAESIDFISPNPPNAGTCNKIPDDEAWDIILLYGGIVFVMGSIITVMMYNGSRVAMEAKWEQLKTPNWMKVFSLTLIMVLWIIVQLALAAAASIWRMESCEIAKHGHRTSFNCYLGFFALFLVAELFQGLSFAKTSSWAFQILTSVAAVAFLICMTIFAGIGEMQNNDMAWAFALTLPFTIVYILVSGMLLWVAYTYIDKWHLSEAEGVAADIHNATYWAPTRKVIQGSIGMVPDLGGNHPTKKKWTRVYVSTPKAEGYKPLPPTLGGALTGAVPIGGAFA